MAEKESAFLEWCKDLQQAFATYMPIPVSISDLSVFRQRYDFGQDPEDVVHHVLSIKDPCHDF